MIKKLLIFVLLVSLSLTARLRSKDVLATTSASKTETLPNGTIVQKTVKSTDNGLGEVKTESSQILPQGSNNVQSSSASASASSIEAVQINETSNNLTSSNTTLVNSTASQAPLDNLTVSNTTLVNSTDSDKNNATAGNATINNVTVVNGTDASLPPNDLIKNSTNVTLLNGSLPFGSNNQNFTANIDSDGEQFESIDRLKTFNILLKGNPTTGYSWILDESLPLNTKVITAINTEGNFYKEDNNDNGNVGAGNGNNIFAFTAANAGEAELRFLYKRPWEQTSANNKTIKVKVNDKTA